MLHVQATPVYCYLSVQLQVQATPVYCYLRVQVPGTGPVYCYFLYCELGVTTIFNILNFRICVNLIVSLLFFLNTAILINIDRISNVPI